MKKEIENLQLLNEELYDFINKPPSWWEKWGLYLLLFMIVIFIFLACIIKYPDKIISRAVLTSYSPPVKLYAEVDGFIEKLFVTDSQYVIKDHILCVIRSSSNYKDVLFIDSLLNKEDNYFYDSCLLNKKLILGELQPYYVDLLKVLENYDEFNKMSIYPQKILAKKVECEKYLNYLNKLNEEFKVYKTSYKLAYSKFKRDSLLKLSNIISDVDYENSLNSLVEKEYELSKIETEIALTKVNIEEIKQEIMDLEFKYKEKEKDFIVEIKKYKNILKAAIKDWKKKYLLISPINGIVTFTKFWNENQYVFKDDLLLTIIPKITDKIIGRVIVKASGAGKIKIGIPVIITLDNYPFYEFGNIKGYVSNISLVPIDEKYILEVSFPNGLKTSFNKIIPFSQEMPGTAEIIIEKKSLMSKILEPLKYIVSYQKNIY